MKGRANYLCLHRLDQLERRRRRRRSHDVFLPIIRDWAARTDTGDRAELEDLPEDLPFWNEVVGDRRNLPRHRVPALRRLLRHADAPARRRVRRRHRQPPPAVRRRGGAAERVRRSHSRLQPTRSSTRRTSSRTSRRSTSASASATTASRISRATSSGWSPAGAHRRRAATATRSRRRSSGCAITRARSSRELAFAHRGDGRVRGEERVRATRRVARRRRARRPRDLTGALDIARIDAARCSDAAPEATRRRRRRRRTAMRRTTSRRWRGAPASCATSCASCCAPTMPTTSTSSSSAAAASSCARRRSTCRAIVRELLLDRMRTTVLTSATLTVDGALRLHPRRGSASATPTKSGCRRSSTSRGRRSCICRGGCRIRGRRTFALAAGREVIEILKRTRGRAFVLFTSYATLRAVQAIAEMALDYPILVAGHGAALAAAQAVPRDAARGAVRDVELLAGRRRRRRGAELRDHRQAAVRLAGRPDHGGPHRRHPRARRRPVRRVSGAAGDPGAAAGARPADPPPPATAASWRSSIRGCGPRATAGGSSPRCRRRPSSTISARSTRFFARSTGRVN